MTVLRSLFLCLIASSNLAAVASQNIASDDIADTAQQVQTEPDAEIIRIVATPVALDETNPDRKDIGEMQYAGGWSLSSNSEHFGGFSGLVIDPADKHLLAITDRAYWFKTEFDAKAGHISHLGSMQPYFQDKELDKIDRDAESLIQWDAGFAVSFEFNHRIDWVLGPGHPSKKLPATKHIDFAGWSGNGGTEAMVRLLDGKLLAFTERGRDTAGLLRAVLADEHASTPLFFKPPRNFAPTDAALLPNGDVLLLLRRFSIVDGVAAKIIRIDHSSIKPGAILTGAELLYLPPQLTVDNMEGLDVVPVNDRTVRLVMISDDNFLPVQRTLLLMFDYNYNL